MAVSFQKQSDLEGQLVVSVKENDFKSNYEKKLKDYAKQANFKGFRPGKVPVAVVQKMVGQSLIAEEVFKVVENEINGYITDNNLTLVGRPLPNEKESNKEIKWQEQKDFEFIYDIATVPSFDIKISKKLSFNDYSIVPSKDKIKEIKESIIKRNGESEQVEEAGKGDVVKGNVKKVGSEEEDKLNLWLDKISTASQEQFIGKKIKDIVSFDIQKFFNSEEALIAQFTGVSKEEAKELSGEYEFEITSITRYKDAELNQEFFDKVFGEGKISSEADMDKEIASNISVNYKQNVDYLLFSQIRKKLLAETKFEISTEFLKRWILEANSEAKMDEIEKDINKYVDEYKWSVIRNKIVDENKITASKEEIENDAYKKVLGQYMGTTDVNDEMKTMFASYIQKYLQEDKGKNYYNHFENVLADKVMSFLKENVSLESKEVTTEEFEKLVEESL